MNTKKIALIGIIIVVIVLIISCFFIMNSTIQYKNVTIGSATFEVPNNYDGESYSYVAAEMGFDVYNSSELYVTIVSTGAASDLFKLDYLTSLLDIKEQKKIKEEGGVQYFEPKDAKFKYFAITKIEDKVVVVWGNNLDIIKHVFSTIKFNSGNETLSNLTSNSTGNNIDGSLSSQNKVSSSDSQYGNRPSVDSSGITREEADYYGFTYTSDHGGHYIGYNDHWDENAGCYHD